MHVALSWNLEASCSVKTASSLDLFLKIGQQVFSILCIFIGCYCDDNLGFRKPSRVSTSCVTDLPLGPCLLHLFTYVQSSVWHLKSACWMFNAGLILSVLLQLWFVKHLQPVTQAVRAERRLLPTDRAQMSPTQIFIRKEEIRKTPQKNIKNIYAYKTSRLSFSWWWTARRAPCCWMVWPRWLSTRSAFTPWLERREVNLWRASTSPVSKLQFPSCLAVLCRSVIVQRCGWRARELEF